MVSEKLVDRHGIEGGIGCAKGDQSREGIDGMNGGIILQQKRLGIVAASKVHQGPMCGDELAEVPVDVEKAHEFRADLAVRIGVRANHFLPLFGGNPIEDDLVEDTEHVVSNRIRDRQCRVRQ